MSANEFVVLAIVALIAFAIGSAVGWMSARRHGSLGTAIVMSPFVSVFVIASGIAISSLIAPQGISAIGAACWLAPGVFAYGALPAAAGCAIVHWLRQRWANNY